MNKNDILVLLEKMDLSTYEARAFLAAMGQPPLTGYKLSQLSGVPRSRIYETIEKLAGKGLLVYQSGKKNLVAPLNFDAYLDRKERENSERIQYLRENLPQMQQHENEGIWNISGRDKILETAQDMIQTARKHIYAGLFGADLPYLEHALLNRQQEGIPVWGIYFGETKIRIKNFFPHMGNCCPSCSEIVVCVDGLQAIIGSTQPPDKAGVALTRNNGFVYIAEKYIRHELFLSKLMDDADDKDMKKYLRKFRSTMNQLPCLKV